MSASIYATIAIMTSNSKYYKAMTAKMVKTIMIINMTKKESTTIFAIVSSWQLLPCTI